MAVRKKTTGMLIYNLLLKEVTAANNLLPENRKLSLKERYALISKKIYPKYKGTSKSQIRLGTLRKSVQWHISRTPAKDGCDALAVPASSLINIDYFSIDNSILQLPECIHVKVNADGFGETHIFNTGDYEYYSSGIAAITNRINEWSRQQKKTTSDIPYYDGVINVRPRRKNDGNPSSYFIHYVLHGGKEKVEYKKVDVPEPSTPKGKKEFIKRKAAGRKLATERQKELAQENQKSKKIKKSFVTEIQETQKFISRAAKEKIKLNVKAFNLKNYRAQKKRADKYLKNESISKKQHTTIINILKKGYDQ